MLTLFSLPKAFVGRAAVLQQNAIESWRRLHPEIELLLFGDETGIAEAANRFGARHISEIQRNAASTPLVGEVFRRAEEMARHDVVGFVNGDIILLNDTLAAVGSVRAQFQKFLIVARRTNLDIDEAIDFSAGWQSRLRASAAARGKLHGHQGSDIFIYRRPMLQAMPNFAVGRTSWDNWIMFHARNSGVALIDATPDLVVVHQNHDYTHVQVSNDPWKGLEAVANLSLAGGEACIYTVYDSTHILVNGRLFSTRTPWYWFRHLRAEGERRVFGWLAQHPKIRDTLKALRRTLT